MMVALPFTGVITVREAIAGFANPNIVLIAAMFVIGEGLASTGIAQGLGDWLVARGGKNETRLVAMLMLIVGALSSVMYFTGVVAIFIPVALRIAQSTGMSPAQVLMPVSFAALISGMPRSGCVEAQPHTPPSACARNACNPATPCSWSVPGRRSANCAVDAISSR
jgi:di/tricarboxylate transporter